MRQYREPRADDQAQEQGGDGAATAGRDSLTVTDNRTGQTFELELTDGAVNAMDFRQMKVSEDDFGLMTYDPAFTNTANCRSDITYIDGAAGVLEHRGYPIEALCDQSSFLEVAYLLVHGSLPKQNELDCWQYAITHHTFVHENIRVHGLSHPSLADGSDPAAHGPAPRSATRLAQGSRAQGPRGETGGNLSSLQGRPGNRAGYDRTRSSVHSGRVRRLATDPLPQWDALTRKGRMKK